jgi:S-adenosylmethionine synthetase
VTQISDAVLDECLKIDPESRVACETYVTMGLVVVGGEVTTEVLFDVAKLVRELGNAIGYTSGTLHRCMASTSTPVPS